MFCDPIHGGNADMSGDPVGYRGPRMSYRDDIERLYGEAFRIAPARFQQLTGLKPDPWDGEEGG